MLPLRHPNKKETFGEELQRRRLDQKCSVAKQAKELNVSKELYRAWEADKAVPETVPFKRIICWCKALSDWAELVREARSAGYGDLPKPEKKDNGHDKELQELMDREPIDVTLLSMPGAMRRVRIDEGLSVEELATLMDEDPADVYCWESAGPMMGQLRRLMDTFPDLAAVHDRPDGLEPIDSYAIINGELGWLGEEDVVADAAPKEIEPMADAHINVTQKDDPTIRWAQALVDVASSPDRRRFASLLDKAVKEEWPKSSLVSTLELCDSAQIKQFLEMLQLSVTLKFDLKTLGNAIKGGE